MTKFHRSDTDEGDKPRRELQSINGLHQLYLESVIPWAMKKLPGFHIATAAIWKFVPVDRHNVLLMVVPEGQGVVIQGWGREDRNYPRICKEGLDAAALQVPSGTNECDVEVISPLGDKAIWIKIYE